GALFRGSMRGRTMYVIPYLMGPAGSPMSRVGLMVTDSAYVVASMHLMTRVGQVAIQHMRRDDDFIAGLHSMGDLSPERRLILHFPEEKLIWSVGSGYGGNALLGKKCHALRIASSQARQEGWLAEHMLLTDGAGRAHRLAGTAVAAGRRRSGSPELALHGARRAMSVDRAELGRAAGRADLRRHLRLAPHRRDPAGVRGVRLVARRVPGLGNE